jgi:hypothetical protein
LVTNKEVVENVLNGYRISIPEQVPSEISDLMKKCWNDDPSQRPTFHVICCSFVAILSFDFQKIAESIGAVWKAADLSNYSGEYSVKNERRDGGHSTKTNYMRPDETL